MKNPVNNINIFEDLIDELKEENLIEETVIQTDKAKKILAESESERVRIEAEIVHQPVFLPEEFDETAAESSEAAAYSIPPYFETAPEFAELPAELFAPVLPVPVQSAPAEPAPAKPASAAQETSDEVDFYRKRAMDEVTFLQMVESAFAGVERDQMKIVPSFYDDLEVKKVLHSYLQVSPKASASERSQAEGMLLQATEAWYSTLAVRDKRVMTAHLRRYCETSRPPLSMPALIALARFYRNSPYSEAVRSKFDLLLTRIFSQEMDGSRRELNFSREELTGYIKELYAEWSSVPMYSTDADDAGILQTVAEFEEFISESNAAANFDALINNNFFNRLRTFKESTNEDFYAPPVAAAAVALNVSIGNRYVALLEREKEKDGIESVENKYESLDDNTVSEATGKTMTLIALLNQKYAAPEPVEETPYFEPAPPPVAKPATEAEKTAAKNTKYAKWIAVAVIFFVVAVSVYFALGYATAAELTSAPPLSLENSMLKDYLKEARVEDDTLNGVVLPVWDSLSSDAKKQNLKLMLSFGGEKGYRKIELVNGKNEKVAIATDGEIYVVE